MGKDDIQFDCIEWAKQEVQKQLLTFGSSLAIVVINYAAQKIFAWTSKNEKHFNKTKENQQLFNLIFAQTLINTAFIHTVSNTFMENFMFESDWF